ncbi:uracil phosphoribosyltransferase-domain-containing protein [Entophlyctis helioformis]|nr:uracil phosphoribosyltransferase-domain-containing protein [Entophlyctis helioformis]
MSATSTPLPLPLPLQTPAPAPAQTHGKAAKTGSDLPPQVRVMHHPLVLHKMSLLRDHRVRSKQFRELVAELTSLVGTLATAEIDLVTSAKALSSPIAPFEGVRLKDAIGVFPILRAGQGMVDSFLSLIPSARVHHLGLYRESSTLLPVEYYNKLPATCSLDLGFVLDPMIATSGTAVAAVNILKDWGLPRIKFVSILASRAGLEALAAAHPDIQIYVAAVDDELDDHGYVRPGLGDAGDRLFKTFYE